MEQVLAQERAAAARSERELQEERRRRQEVESASRAQEAELRVLRAEQEKRELDATRAREETRHLRNRLEDTAHSNPNELDRLRKLLTAKENEVKHLEGRVQASSEVITTYLAKEREARATARVAAKQPSSRSGEPAVRKRRNWEPMVGGSYFFAAAEATTEGEERLFIQPWPAGWLVVGNPTVTQGTKTRETDALVITPRGMAVIEQKDTHRSGDLWFPPNGPPTVDGIAVESLDGALLQARRPAQLLASLCKNEDFNPGYVESVLSIWGDINFTQTRQNQIHLCRTEAVVDTLEEVLGRRSDPLAVGTVEWLLLNLGVGQDGLPSWTELGYAA